MDKITFLNELELALDDLPRREKDNKMYEYENLFYEEELKGKTEEQIVNKLKDPYDIAKEISTYIPDFKINYSPDFRNKIAKSWPSSINDQDARKDWGWEGEFDLKKMTLKMIEGIRTNNSLASSSI